MTVIAYRAGVFAADGRETMQNSVGDGWYCIRDNCVKVFVLSDGSLFGAAHGSEDIEKLYRHLKEAPGRQDLPDKLDDITAMRLDPAGKLWMTEGGLWTECDLEYFAIGSGGFAALCAMDAGADAHTAAKVACKRDLWCGGKITVVKLNP